MARGDGGCSGQNKLKSAARLVFYVPQPIFLVGCGSRKGKQGIKSSLGPNPSWWCISSHRRREALGARLFFCPWTHGGFAAPFPARYLCAGSVTW